MTTQQAESPTTVAVVGTTQALTRCSYGAPGSAADTSADEARPPAECDSGSAHSSGYSEYAARTQPTQPTGGSDPAQVACTCPLSGSWQAIPAARHFVTRTLRHWGLDMLAEEIELVVSELVTNALRHGLRLGSPGASAPEEQPSGTDTNGDWDEDSPDGPIELKLLHNGRRVVCVVTDPSDEVPVCTPVGQPGEAGLDMIDDADDPTAIDEFDYVFGLAEAGHGLHLVTAYSHRWGHAPRTDGGKAVWAMFDSP